MEALTKETLLGQTLVETLEELVAGGRIHPHLAKSVMYVLENKPGLSFLSQLEINARELVLYRRRGRVLEVQLRDVSLDRVFNHVQSRTKRYPVLTNFAHIKRLTMYAFNCQHEDDTEAYLRALTLLMDKDVSELKEHFLRTAEPEHTTTSKDVTVTKKKPKKPKKPSLTHRSSRDDHNMPRLRKLKKGPRGRPRKVSTCPPLPDSVGLGSDALPRDVMQVRDSVCQEHAADSMAAGNRRGTGKSVKGRGNVSDRVTASHAYCFHRVALSPIEEAPAQEDGRAETTREGSSSLLKSGRRRGRPALSRGTTRPQGPQGDPQEVPYVSRKVAEMGEMNDDAGGSGEASKDKELGEGCSGGGVIA